MTNLRMCELVSLVVILVAMSNAQIQPGGGPRPPSLATVCTDQSTIRGSGTSDDPLHVGDAAGGDLVFEGVDAIDVCAAVCLKNSLSSVAGIDVADPTNLSGAGPNAFVIGLVKSYDAAKRELVVQRTGLFTGSADDWNNITGSPILVPGDTYYLAGGTVLTTTRPTTPGDNIVVIGQAFSRTQMLLGINAPVHVP